MFVGEQPILCDRPAPHEAEAAEGAILVPTLSRFEGSSVAIALGHEHGVKVAFGTDLCKTLHDRQAWELVLGAQVEPPLEVLRSATIVGAEVVGQAGALVSRAYADALAVRGTRRQLRRLPDAVAACAQGVRHPAPAFRRRAGGDALPALFFVGLCGFAARFNVFLEPPGVVPRSPVPVPMTRPQAVVWRQRRTRLIPHATQDLQVRSTRAPGVASESRATATASSAVIPAPCSRALAKAATSSLSLRRQGSRGGELRVVISGCWHPGHCVL